MWHRLGVQTVGLSLRKCEELGLDTAAAAVDADGLTISNLVECGWFDLTEARSWAATQQRWRAAIDAFAPCAPWCLVVTTGGAAPLMWDEAAACFADAIAPVTAHARDRGVTIALEHTGSLRVDLSFVHRLRDALDVAEMCGVCVCAELSSCWAERDVDELLGDDRVVHVQLSDVAQPSWSTPDRAVPGDGDIPLARLLRALERRDYSGAVELELVGPRIEREGYERAIARALDWWAERVETSACR